MSGLAATVGAPGRRSAADGVGALAQDAVIYGGTRLLLKVMALLLAPLYAGFLTPAQFGALELVLAIGVFLEVLVTANMDQALGRFYFERADHAWRRQVITLYLLIEAIYPAILIGALIVFSGPLATHLLGRSDYGTFFVIAFLGVYVMNIVDLPLILCRLQRRPLAFAGYALSHMGMQVAFTVLLVVFWRLEVKGALIAMLLAAAAIFVLTLRTYVRELTLKIDWGVGREMLSFAWPGIAGVFAIYAINVLDRVILTHYHGLADNGLYGAAFRFSQVGAFAFVMAWNQWQYSWMHSERHPQMVARGATYYFFGTGLITVLISAWILPAFHVLMPDRYWDATRAVPPLALGAAAAGTYALFVVGLNVTKRVRVLIPIGAVAIGVATLLYLVLIPPFAYVGAAWATFAAFCCLALLVLAAAQRVYPIPWHWSRLAATSLLTVGLCLACLAIDAWVEFGASLPLRVAVTLSFPLLLVALRLVPSGDLAVMRRAAVARARGV